MNSFSDDNFDDGCPENLSELEFNESDLSPFLDDEDDFLNGFEICGIETLAEVCVIFIFLPRSVCNCCCVSYFIHIYFHILLHRISRKLVLNWKRR